MHHEHLPGKLHCCTEITPTALEDARNEDSAKNGPGGTLSDTQYLAALRCQTWANGAVVGVRFLDGDPALHDRVQKFANLWSEFANIRFAFGATDAAVRVSFKEEGSWSRLGKDARNVATNQATMNFGWIDRDSSDLEVERVVLHEFGHALGFIHEHQNPNAGIPWNKDRVYAWYQKTHGWDRAKVDFNVLRRYEMSTTQFSKFDPSSIMLYPIAKELTSDGFCVGLNSTLSAVDKAWAGTVYPKPVDSVTRLAPNGEWKQAEISGPGEVDVYQFDIKEPGVYTVETGGNNDSILSLAGPDSDELLEQGDDGGLMFWNARITRPLSAGRYTLKVWYYKKADKGFYTVRVGP